MSQGHGLFNADRAKTTMLVVMQIRAADATKSNFDANLITAQCRQLCRFDSQILGGVADDGAHEKALESEYLECSGDAAIHIEDVAIDKARRIAG